MSVVIDDLPPLMWHAELGRSLPDLWSGKNQRGVQLHDLRDAVTVWSERYEQRAWLRQLEPPATSTMEDEVLRTIARLDGTPFPSTARLASRWLRGRVPDVVRRAPAQADLETAYCAEVVAVTYEAMGLLSRAGNRTGTTRAGSGAVTSCRCRPARDSVARSPSRSTRPAGPLRRRRVNRRLLRIAAVPRLA